LDLHYRETAALVEQAGGRIVNHTGDGVLAVFDLPSMAIECALGLRSRLGDLGIEIRAAIHFGEVTEGDGDISGMTVHVAARVLGIGSAGVVVTEVTREMALGSRARFEDLDEMELRDIPGVWRLYEARI
jgi:class 3 adenylate cyclase